MDEKIEISFSKSKTIMLLILSFIFVLLGVGLIFIGSILYITVGLTAIIFFGFSSCFILYKVLENKPGLIISNKGITDKSSFISVGFIPWEDIKEISNYTLQGQSFAAIYPFEPEKYLCKDNILKRLFKKSNQIFFGTPVYISTNGLEISSTELLELLQKSLQKYKRKTKH